MIDAKDRIVLLCETLGQERNEGYKIAWERMDYMDLIGDKGLLWPGTLVHSKITSPTRYVIPTKTFKGKSNVIVSE